MKISYLDDNSWEDITREERFFCAELYYNIRENPQPFFNLLEETKNCNVYDIGYEVCFYRDVLKKHGKEKEFQESIKSITSELSPMSLYKSILKRTFDLALLSENEIIIIEAKAQAGFDTKQMEDFERDKELIRILFEIIGKKEPKISLYAITSSLYNPKASTENYFNIRLTWEAIAEVYKTSKRSETIFLHANNIFRK
jgi:hypothetical protein